MNKSFRLMAAGALVTVAMPMAAWAQVSPQSTPLTVSATVTSVCALSAPSNIGFSSIAADNTAKNASGSITVTCNKGATVSATAASFNVSSGQKRMRRGTTDDYLNYTVWQPDLAALGACAGTPTDWSGALVMSSLWTSAGGPHAIPVCATTTPGTATTPGIYTDTLTVQITFS
jgi:spore coat protein U-like protein